jgi:intein-encoded DNA endonuclease-like protein
MSDGNTEGSRLCKLQIDPVETTRQHLLQTTKAYLLGAIHDAAERKTTFRISQKYRIYPDFIKKLLARIGKKAWIYKEGKSRKVYVVEFSKSFLKGFEINSLEEKKAYIRGYFDSEGGLTKNQNLRLYIYFAQKDRQDLEKVYNFLSGLGISCGVIHNPSKKVDPNYWRFFVKAKSYQDFAEKIGSWHPRKSRLLRMKI